jgi:hypothetical protein
MACNLRGYKRPVFRQFLVDEFHFSAVSKRFDPLFVLHFRTCSGGGSVASIRRLAQRNSFFLDGGTPRSKPTAQIPLS